MQIRLMRRALGSVVWTCSMVNTFAAGITDFGTIAVSPAFELNGDGVNVDSVAFWEAPDPGDTLLFVTAKANDLLEVWKYPFEGNSLPSMAFADNVNGVAVDQEADLLYVSDRRISVLSLPDVELLGEFGEGVIGVGENNLDILMHSNGQTQIFVSDEHNIHRFDAAGTNYLGSFAPPVASIETVLADDFYQVIYVPEEQGPLGNPGVYAFHPDGTPYERNGTNRFGNNGEFEADEEGILLYTFPSSGAGDDGTGFIVVSDQKGNQTDFEIFDRQTWSHLGTLRIDGVSNTDGIASTQKALPDYPMGLFVAVNNDATTVGVGWDAIFEAMGYTPYQVWALAKGLVIGVNAGFVDDPDGDGRANIGEFAGDGHPLDGGDGGKARAAIENIAGTDRFTYTFPVRNGAVFTGAPGLSAVVDGIVYAVTGSVDLEDFHDDVVELAPALEDGLPALHVGWSYRTFRSSKSASEVREDFILLQVMPGP